MERLDLQYNWKLSAGDRKMLVDLADHLGRSQADTLRTLVEVAYTSLGLPPVKKEKLPAEVIDALKAGSLKLADLSADSLGLGDLSRFDLTAFAQEQPARKTVELPVPTSSKRWTQPLRISSAARTKPISFRSR